MTNDEFRCWISGYLTLSDESHMDQRQFKIIKDHANLVRAISLSLDDSIINFISILEAKFSHQATVSFCNAKEYAFDTCLLIGV